MLKSLKCIRPSLIFLIGILLGFHGEVTSSYAQNAPFGVKWGSTEQQLKEQGIMLRQVRTNQGIKLYAAKWLPKTPSKTGTFVLYIGPKFGLQKIKWTSSDINEDPYGSEGKKQYEALKNLLSKEYGKPLKALTAEMDSVGLLTEFYEFYECLKKPKCGVWTAGWKGKFGGVFLTLQGRARGRGFIEVTYEGPSWSSLVKERKKATRKTDREAF